MGQKVHFVALILTVIKMFVDILMVSTCPVCSSCDFRSQTAAALRLRCNQKVTVRKSSMRDLISVFSVLSSVYITEKQFILSLCESCTILTCICPVFDTREVFSHSSAGEGGAYVLKHVQHGCISPMFPRTLTSWCCLIFGRLTQSKQWQYAGHKADDSYIQNFSVGQKESCASTWFKQFVKSVEHGKKHC